MSELIKGWLLDQLGLVLESETWNAEVAGVLIAKLLHRYDLVTQEQVNCMEFGEDNFESTIEYIRSIIVGLGIDLSIKEFREVLTGHTTKATILFYELYLALHDKNTMHYVAERKIKECNKDIPQRFQVEKVPSECSEVGKFNNALAMDLVNNADVIQWHKSRMQIIVEKCKASREAYLDFLRDNEIKDVGMGCKPKATVEISKPKTTDIPCSDTQTLNLTIDELLDEEERAKLLCEVEPDPKISRNIISAIKRKHRKDHARTERQECMQRMLLKELWDKMLAEQKKYFDGEFGNKLLKQSVYEQQMVTRLFEIRQQRDRMYKNKLKLMECTRLENEKKFTVKLMKDERKVEDEKLRYYMERERNLELHERLYAEKLRKKAVKNYNMCFKALESIVDVATYKAGYEEWFCQTLPRNKMIDLVDLFIKDQPIFSQLDDEIELLDYEPDKFPEDLENIYIAEIERDNCIDDMKFEEYCLNYWSWSPEEFPDVDYDAVKLGNNIVGFIVHRLLLIKYPKRPLPPPLPVPKSHVAVCANGLTDLKYIPALERLLQARKIKVIQMQDGMNYCLGVWKKESTREYMEEVLTKETEAVAKKTNKKDTKDKPLAKGSKGKSTKGKSNQSDPGGAGDHIKTFDCKLVQTPILFPDEELVLTPAGDLGRLAFEVLNLGETPNDHLMVAMFLEYLKSLNEIEGWVLINYPKTMQQVAVLEETLTSVPFPINTLESINSLEDVVDLDDRELEQNIPLDDLNADKRISKIVPNPKPSEDLIFETYLTAYIEIRSAEGDDIEEQYYDCFRTVQNDNAMNRFYMDQGCKYTLTYQEMDFPTIKHLGKLILGEYTLPQKTSVQLFTDTVKYVEAEFHNLIDRSTVEKVVGARKPAKDDKKKAKKDSTEKTQSKKDTKSKSGDDKKAKVVIVHEDKETQAPEIEEDEEPHEEDVVVPPPKPGEEHWIYINLPIPDEFAKIIASIWENLEEVYINDVKQLFFRERVLLEQVAPFKKFLLMRMRAFLERPSNKQTHLHQFQLCYNEFDDDMRNDEEVKAEIHMRIHEFKEKLYELCDDLQQENENERKRIIRENWVTNLIFEIANIFSSFMQLEIDRCSDTLQMLNDYYTTMVTNNPSQDRPLEKIKLKLISMPDHLSSEDMRYSSYMETTLIGRKSVNYADSPYHNLLEENEKVCVAKISDYKKSTQAVYENVSSMFVSKEKPAKKVKSLSNYEPSPEVKDRAEELLEEYKSAYLGEVDRTLFRIHMAVYKGRNFIEEIIFGALDTFLLLHTENDINYRNHLESVDKACEIFSRAVEEETKIQPEMVFISDQFYIKLDSVLYEAQLPEEPEPILEKPSEEWFTMEQLNRICGILMDLAPTGQMPERSFTFLLQDLLVCNVEDGKPAAVPKLWSEMRPHDTHKFMREVFGDTEYIDWKDFLIYNLGIPFPTEAELMRTRNSFKKLDPDHTELIYEHQFAEVTFWFEDDSLEQSRLKMIREFLIRLYKIDESRINYTALLLSFCKDEDPLAGLAKAVQLSLGRYICWRREQGEEYYDWLIEDVLQMKAEDKENELMADDILSDIIDTAVHKTTSTYLEDYVDEQDEQEPYPDYTYGKDNRIIDIFAYLRETTRNMVNLEESASSVFTNLSQGRESSGKTTEYFLDFDTIINVLTVALPWHAKNKNIGDCSLREKVAHIYQTKYNYQYNRVFTYQLFNEPEFVALVNSVYKFCVKDPTGVVRQLVNKM